MSTVITIHGARDVRKRGPRAHAIAPPADGPLRAVAPYGEPGVAPTGPALVEALRRRGVRVYPDLEGGIGLVARGVNYADLRPPLAACKAEAVAYLEAELSYQRLAELMAFFAWEPGRMRAALLDRAERGGTLAHWEGWRTDQLIARALRRAEEEPEVPVTIGYSTRRTRWYPTAAEVAEHLAELGAEEAEILRALRRNNAHHTLGYEEEELEALARGEPPMPAPAPAIPPPAPVIALPAHMGPGLLAFAAAHGHTCAYCARRGDHRGDPDGRPWHRDHVPRLGGPNPFVLACASCKALPDRQLPEADHDLV